MVISTLVCAFLLFMLAYFLVLLTGETVRAVILHVNAYRANHMANQPN